MVRLVFLLIWGWSLTSFTTYGQSQAYAKLYIGDSPFDLRVTLDPSTPLAIGSKTRTGYVLIETDLDSLGLILPKNRQVFLRLESGKSYYYSFSGFGYRDQSENAFWLTQAAYAARRYQHYIITRKLGVVRAYDSDN